MSSIPNLIVTPLDATVCCTCAKWEGARVLLDGHCHSLAEAVGYCQNTSGESRKPIWQLSMKLAPEAACEGWHPTDASMGSF